MALAERTQEISQRRLELLMARAQQADAVTALTAQLAETDKQLHALDGALELARVLAQDEAQAAARPKLVPMPSEEAVHG